jgi:hypothetical protein
MHSYMGRQSLVVCACGCSMSLAWTLESNLWMSSILDTVHQWITKSVSIYVFIGPWYIFLNVQFSVGVSQIRLWKRKCVACMRIYGGNPMITLIYLLFLMCDFLLVQAHVAARYVVFWIPSTWTFLNYFCVGLQCHWRDRPSLNMNTTHRIQYIIAVAQFRK